MFLSGVSEMKKFTVLLWIFPVLMFASCSSLQEVGGDAVQVREFTGADEQTAFAAASAYMESFFQSLESGEFSIWKKVLDEQHADQITEDKFHLMRNELLQKFGKIESKEFLGSLITGNFRNYLWKVRFNKTDNGNSVVREVIYYTKVFCPENGNPAVSGFGVKLF